MAQSSLKTSCHHPLSSVYNHSQIRPSSLSTIRPTNHLRQTSPSCCCSSSSPSASCSPDVNHPISSIVSSSSSSFSMIYNNICFLTTSTKIIFINIMIIMLLFIVGVSDGRHIVEHRQQSPTLLLQRSERHQPHPPSPPQQQENSTQEECTLASFQKCIATDLWSGGGGGSGGTVGGDLAFPTTMDELQLACTDLKERVQCLDRHSQRCFTHEMMQVFGQIVMNAKQFVHYLCDDKKVQAEYLVHAKCFRNISLDEQKCAQEYRDAISLPPTINNNQQPQFILQQSPAAVQTTAHHQPLAEALMAAPPPPPQSSFPSFSSSSSQPSFIMIDQQQQQQLQLKEIIMRRSCCALQELVLCKRRHVREQCGQSASIFMRDHLPRITDPVLEQHCSAYTYGPGTCDEALYGVHGRNQPPVLPSGAIILQRQQQQFWNNNPNQQQSMTNMANINQNDFDQSLQSSSGVKCSATGSNILTTFVIIIMLYLIYNSP